MTQVARNDVIVERYSYDQRGVRTTETNQYKNVSGKTYAYSDEDHLLTAGDATYSFNQDGFLKTKRENGKVTVFDYRLTGDLDAVHLPDGRLISYDYDPLGRRITKRIDGVIVEKYLWEGLTRLLAVYDRNDRRLMRFQYADARMPVAMTYQGNTYYLLYDQVGSLRIIADENGSVVKQIDYDSFGYVINDSAPSFSIPFGFAGGLYDAYTGLLRFGYRDYDPEIGRWTAKDPIFFAGGDTDLYGYCLNNPVNCIDPWGLVNWGTVGIGTLSVLGGSVTAVTGALASATGAGAIGGVAAVLFGTAAFSWGISQIIVGFLDDRIPFMGVKEAVIKGTTQSGLLQDELLGINSLGDILLTGRTLPTDIGKVDSLLQSGYSIYSSGSTIVDAMGTANSSIASSLCK